MARNVQKNVQILIACESVCSGRTSREIKDLDIASVIKTLYYYAGSVGNSLDFDTYESLGVVAICGYFDSPLLSIINKIAAALATGNTCVVVPHKLTPLSTYLFLEICAQSGLPKGVVNLIASGILYFNLI
jgi:aldehyde dehydrogenase (NAD+)